MAKKSSSNKNIKSNSFVENGGAAPTSVTNSSFHIFHYINQHVMFLNSSKFFAGVVMILLNIGSKVIAVQFSKSTEEYMKYSVSKQILVFAMAWMGTRDIYTALGLTAVFTILSEYLFNEESSLCLVPHQYRVLHKLIDTNDDGVVSELELSQATAVLEKAKRDNQKKAQQDAFMKFDVEKDAGLSSAPFAAATS